MQKIISIIEVFYDMDTILVLKWNMYGDFGYLLVTNCVIKNIYGYIMKHFWAYKRMETLINLEVQNKIVVRV